MGALLETIDWIAAAIPSGLPREVSGGGCVQLTLLRTLTGMEVEWVEGWTLPAEFGWMLPVDVSLWEIDCPAYGRLGLSPIKSGFKANIGCEIPTPPTELSGSCPVAVTGKNGQVWMTGPRPVFVQLQLRSILAFLTPFHLTTSLRGGLSGSGRRLTRGRMCWTAGMDTIKRWKLRLL